MTPEVRLDGRPNGSADWRADWRVPLLLALIAMLLYLPGITWGTPQADGLGRSATLAPDELGPTGPLVLVRNALQNDSGASPQYPLFHYIFLCIFYAPYLLFEILRGGLRNPQRLYPYGFANPVRAIHILFLIARGVSILMGAGIVVVAYFTASELWDRFTAVLAATFVMLLFPMFYYSRISNVDVPAVFWTSIVLFLFVRILQDGLSLRRALFLGLFSALAVATKDQYYAAIVVLPLIFLPLHIQRMREAGAALWQSCAAPLAGLFVAGATYGLASGLFIRPARYFRHINFIRFGAGTGWYYKYPATLAGYAGLARESLGYLASTLSWPLLLAATAGALLCLRRNRLNLSLLVVVPAIFLLVLVPVRLVLLRFLILPAYVLALYAAFAIAAALRSSRTPLRWTAGLAAAAACAFMLLHGADLTYSMMRDPRDQASAWLNAHTRDGDQVEIFAPVSRAGEYPQLNPGRRYISSRLGDTPNGAWLQGDFVIVLVNRANLRIPFYPDWVDHELRSGARDYLPVATFQNRSYFDFQELPVNQRLDIFARRNRALELFAAGEGPVSGVPASSGPTQ